MTLKTMKYAAAACAIFTIGLATEARAELNLRSSTTVQCVGASYGGQDACAVLRFTLQIPDPQVPFSVGPGEPAGMYGDFGVTSFALQSFLGQWAFESLLNASPGTWSASLDQNTWQIYGAQANSTGTGGFPPPPIVFDVQMSAYEAELIMLDMKYSANGYGRHVDDGVTAYAWSTGGDITSTVPEPATMILLGSGLMGLAGIGRRRRRNAVENA